MESHETMRSATEGEGEFEVIATVPPPNTPCDHGDEELIGKGWSGEQLAYSTFCCPQTSQIWTVMS